MRPLCVLCLITLVLCLTGCDVELYHSLPEDEANQMLAILMLHRIDASKKQEESGIALHVEKSQFINAVQLLRLNGFPHRQYTTAETLFPANQLVVSPQEEQQKISFLKEQRIEWMLSQMDGVVSANVTIALPSGENDSSASPSSVAAFIKYSPQVNLEAFRVQIKELVERSIPGLQYSKISILMQPAEFRMMPAVSKTQRSWVSDSFLDTGNVKVGQWLKKHYHMLFFSLMGLFMSLIVLLGYRLQKRRR